MEASFWMCFEALKLQSLGTPPHPSLWAQGATPQAPRPTHPLLLFQGLSLGVPLL